MGHYYSNLTLRLGDRNAVAAKMKEMNRKAFLSPVLDGFLVICDQEFDSDFETAAVTLGHQLTGAFQTSGIAVANYDDDVLCYWLFASGTTVDKYNSFPAFFLEPEDQMRASPNPTRANVGEICQALQPSADMAAVESTLERPTLAEGGLFSAVERHLELVHALRLPEFSVGASYEAIASGNVPCGFSPDDLLAIDGR